jgi:predicted permease
MTDSFDRWREVRRAFRLPFSRRRARREVDEEFAFHLQERVDQFMAAGMSRTDAEAEAHGRFGDLTRHRSQTTAIHEATMQTRQRSERLRGVVREVAHAARVLRRTPTFSLVAIGTLALGIGATTAIFMVLDAVVLRPLPYRHSEELVSVLQPATVPGSGDQKWGMSAAGYFHFKANNTTLSDLGGYRTGGLTVTGEGGAETVQVGMITASIVSTLQARPALGRLIQPEDDVPGAAPVVVLSHAFWQRRFGGDPGVVGTRLATANGAMEIVGVAEPGLTLPKPGPFGSTANLAGFGVEVWQAMQLDPAARPQNSHQYSGIGRLKPGVTPAMAQADFQTMTARFPELFPTAYSAGFMEQYQFRAAVIPLRNEVLGPSLGSTLWMLFGAVGLVLVIALANVANLFLVRMEARRRESAIRTALGADRPRMLTLFLSESLLLTMVAGLLGLGLAWAGLRALLVIAPTNVPRLAGVTLGWEAGAFALGLSIVTGVILGLLPMARTRVDVEGLREGGRGLTSGPGPRRVRSTLVVGQVALALMLLAAAGLMLKSVARLRGVEPGLDPTGVLTVSISIPFAQYGTLDAGVAFHRQVHERIAALPGVTTVGATTALPLRDFGGCSVVFREGRPYGPDEQTPCVATPRATPGFFAAMGITVEGTAPAWSDVDSRSGAAVVTRALADRLWPGEDPIGKGITTNGGPDSPFGYYPVTGVIPELRAAGLDQPPSEAVFYPASERVADVQWGALHDLEYTVKTTLADPVSLVGAIRQVLSELNPDVPLVAPMTMRTVVEQSMARTAFVMTLLSLAGGMALLLSAVGIYGVISYLVAQRRGEIGVRMALGARVPQVARLVVGQSLALVAVGVVLGLLGAVVGMRLLQAVLYDVSPTDPGILMAVSGLLLAIAAVASVGPARRAARVQPVEVLRAE